MPPDCRAPARGVLAAFGIDGRLRRLPGGRGTAWRAGDVVIKPTGSVAESRWRAEVLSALPDLALVRAALVRAWLYRIATNVGLQLIGEASTERPEAYERVVELVAEAT